MELEGGSGLCFALFAKICLREGVIMRPANGGNETFLLMSYTCQHSKTSEPQRTTTAAKLITPVESLLHWFSLTWVISPWDAVVVWKVF